MRTANSQIVGRFVFGKAPTVKDKRIVVAKAPPPAFADAAIGFGGVAVFAVGLWFLLLYGL